MLFHSRHLALLQAAVRYFREEFGPHPPELLQDYLREPDPGLTMEQLHELQPLLEHCQLKSGRLVPESGVIEFISFEESRRADLIAVLVFDPSQAGHQFGE